MLAFHIDLELAIIPALSAASLAKAIFFIFVILLGQLVLSKCVKECKVWIGKAGRYQKVDVLKGDGASQNVDAIP